MFNHSITEGVKILAPARSTFSDKNSNFGVEIKPTILEKQKFENEKQDVEPNPNTFTSSITIVTTETIMTGSKIETPQSASITIVTPETIMTGSKLNLPYSASIRVSETGSGFTTFVSSSIVNPYTGSISISPSTTDSAVVLPKSGTIDYSAPVSYTHLRAHET